MKTHWKQLINPDFLGAYSLPEGQDMTVTIKNIARQEIVGDGGRKEECTVAHIKNNKPLILNRTNQKTIARMYGPYIEDWADKNITLYAAMTKLKNEEVECLRVRPQAPKKPGITTDRLKGAIKSINDGGYTVEQLTERFDLTAEQYNLVLAETGSQSA